MATLLKYACFFAVIWQQCVANPGQSGAIIEDRCTTVIVGKDAGTEGPMTSHTSDCLDCDFRINKVPAKDWPKGATRPIYLFKNTYPATITSNRGDTWMPSNLQGSPSQLAAWGEESPTTAEIPQVEHTYALYEAGYGVINEHQVAIGESTCAARFFAAPRNVPGFNGTAGIEVNEMSRIALERTTTAVDAIKLMGQLAEDLGYYTADWESGGDGSLGEGGEALTVIDAHDAWVFHVLGDDTGTSAIWVAQRVPPGHVSVVANQFTIREVVPGSKDFMYSDNLWEVAKRNGLWSNDDDSKLLDFATTYGLPRAHSIYATRRVWRVYSLVAPSLKLDPTPTDYWASNLPFSVKAEKKLSPQDIFAINRDHYEGTQFDLTKGLAAGPYGDPNRFDPAPVDNMTLVESLSGSYERAISLFRTSYSVVSQARAAYPREIGARVWFCPSTSRAGAYIPLYVSARTIHPMYTTGSLFKYNKSVAFWNFDAVSNYASRYYKYAMQEVRAVQRAVETKIQNTAAEHDALALSFYNLEHNTHSHGLAGHLQYTPDDTDALNTIADIYTSFTLEMGSNILTQWQGLLETLFTKYHDGAIATNLNGTAVKMVKMFYPRWWLNATGYFNEKPNYGPGVLMFEASPVDSAVTAAGTTTAGSAGDAALGATPSGISASASAASFSAASLVLCSLIALLVGLYVGKRWGQQIDGVGRGASSYGQAYSGLGFQAQQHSYQPIPQAHEGERSVLV